MLGILKHPDEYRQFKNSAATHVIKQSKDQNAGCVHVSNNIVKGGGFIKKGCDNADINCQTL